MKKTAEQPAEPEQIEDDIADLIEMLVDDGIHGENSSVLKEQVRWALNKLIDERIALDKRRP